MKNKFFFIKDLSFQYPFSNSEISWKGEITINEHDIILLSGNSGSGKSTLLYLLKGLIPHSIYGIQKGIIDFKQKTIEKLDNTERAKIGFLFQNPATQMINRTVRQELALGLENLRTSPEEIKQKIADLAEKFQITNILDRSTQTLSGGEKQKIAFISILLMKPEVLLLDEPTSFLSPDSAQYFIEVFQQIATSQTIIIVEHNLNYLKNLINRNIHISSTGKIVEREITQIIWENRFPEISHKEPNEILFNVKNLHFSYPRSPLILKNLDFDIRRNEIVGIVGDNGSGKSTFLKILSGLLKKYNGAVFLKDINIKNMKPNALYHKVALLFQNPENHFIFNTILKEVSGKYRFLEDVGLKQFPQRNPFTLSEGEKRRLSLAIQWSMEREIFLLDEPTFGQDYQNKLKLINLLEKLSAENKTFLIVSHDHTFLKAVCNRILKLSAGKFENYEN